MTVSLRDFATKALEHSRIRFGDLRRLQRDVLPFRITSHDEAEVLLAFDGTVERADRDWTDYLVPAVAQFVIWGSEPVERIDQSKAAWLMGAVAAARAKTAAAIIREVVRDAPLIDDAVHFPRGRYFPSVVGPAPRPEMLADGTAGGG